MSRTSRALLPASLGLLALLATGCQSSTDNDTGDDAHGVTETTVEVPDFSGPYAAEFAESYQSAESDFVRRALEDENISDAEYAEMTERFRQCLADVGITFKGFDSTGAYSTTLAPNADDTHELVGTCVTESGQDAIGLLRDLISVNPQNLDTATIMAECLVREGVVEPGYGPDDYTTDSTGRFADLEALPADLAEAVESCSSDPLGLE
ncbi:MAG: hypothetical protein HGA44_10400 [Cellulomonadaceae bacterium]|nr:hypothetical protein [Cellulomonadaceae bacterium]